MAVQPEIRKFAGDCNFQQCEVLAPSHIVFDGVYLEVFFIVFFFQRHTTTKISPGKLVVGRLFSLERVPF